MKKDIELLLKAPIVLEPDNFTDHMWGGDWIARFKGLGTEPGVVIGESWDFSSRSEHPTQVSMPAGGRISLRELIAAAPNEVLGSSIVQRFGAEAPILLKFIDAQDNLSLQVHPFDEYARQNEKDSGKSEAWIVLDTGSAEGEGFIYLGFNPEKVSDYSNPADFEEAFFSALNQTNAQGPSTNPKVREDAERLILPFLERILVKPGEVYDVKPGTVHALGKGVRIFEIQQASDLTYRVWDWNRPDAKKLKEGKLEFRPLHIDKAKDVLNFTPQPAEAYRLHPTPVKFNGDGAVFEEVLVLDADKKFGANRIHFKKENTRFEIKTNGSFQVLTVLQGKIDVGSAVGSGYSVLIPACLKSVNVQSLVSDTHVIRSYVPV